MTVNRERRPQVGLTFVHGDPLHRRLTEAARRHGVKSTRVLRELVRDYLDQWIADQYAHRRELRRRALQRRRA